MSAPRKSSPTAELEAGLTGAAAPPRRNGELVFDEPWQSRAFGLAVALHQAGVFAWNDFRGRLIARIAAWETEAAADEEYPYYRHWLGALEDVLLEAGVTDRGVLNARAEAIAGRPAHEEHARHHGPDHDHHHHHHHQPGDHREGSDRHAPSADGT